MHIYIISEDTHVYSFLCINFWDYPLGVGGVGALHQASN